MLPAGELELPGQLEHAAEPLTLLNEPTLQMVQGPPSGPVKPGAHPHAALPLAALVLLGQGRQFVPPVEFKYVLAAHAWQVVLSSKNLK